MTVDEVKNTLLAYDKIEQKAKDILDAGNISFDSINYVYLCGGNNKNVDICYYAFARETYIDNKKVPVEWFTVDTSDLERLWKEKREAERIAEEKRIEEERKKFAAEQRRKSEAKRKKEIAELKRLRKKYPDI